MLSAKEAFELLYGDPSLRGARVIVLAIVSLVMEKIEALQGASFFIVLPIIGASHDDEGQAMVRIHLPDEPIAGRFATYSDDRLSFVARLEWGCRRIIGSMDGAPDVQIRVKDDQLLVQFVPAMIHMRTQSLDD
jgi:hypothetical protein